MSDSLGTISTPTVLAWTALEQGGKTTVVTFTEYKGSLGNARTISQWPLVLGSENYLQSAATPGLIWALLFTKNEALQAPPISTPRSHSGCWCNSYVKRDTSDA